MKRIASFSVNHDRLEKGMYVSRAAAAEMEGAAAAQTAAYGSVPFAVLRVISDQADGRAAESFEAFEEQTAALSAAVIVRLLDLI